MASCLYRCAMTAGGTHGDGACRKSCIPAAASITARLSGLSSWH
ncbi:hypothetical protein SXCC_04326 [Gluconacetobacter sp. SXCC-1]|nr:hypothetical protein SXCC_04326 [Gluconacetobacter sp. SXCC-1]